MSIDDERDGGAAPGELLFALALPDPHGGSRAYVVLAHDVDDAWIAGEPRLVDVDALRIATSRDVERSRLPAELSGSLEARYVARDAEAIVCEGPLGAPLELRLVDAQYLEIGEPGGTLRLAMDREPYARLLVAPIESSCEHEVGWAHRVDRAPRATFLRSPGATPDRDRDEALRALRALPEYGELQAQYASYVREPAAEEDAPTWWEDYEGSATVTALVDQRGRTLYVAHIEAGYGCGGFGGALWGIFERAPSGELSLLERSADADPPLGAVDLDGDGRLELVRRDEIEEGDTMHRIAREPFVCPC